MGANYKVLRRTRPDATCIALQYAFIKLTLISFTESDTVILQQLPIRNKTDPQAGRNCDVSVGF